MAALAGVDGKEAQAAVKAAQRALGVVKRSK